MANGSLPKRIGDIKDAAGVARVSTATIRRRMRSGHLTPYRMGRQILRFDLDEVEQLFTAGTDAA